MTNEESLDSEMIRTYELIGRNILLFQQMEGLLKHLLPVASLEGRDANELETKHQKNQAKVEKDTLGNLVNEFFEVVVVSEANNADKDREDPGVAISFRLVLKSEQAVDELRRRFKDLVDSRNHLVHHFLSDLNHDNRDSRKSARHFLKQLRRRTQNEIEVLRKMAQNTKTFSEALSHPAACAELKRPGSSDAD